MKNDFSFYLPRLMRQNLYMIVASLWLILSSIAVADTSLSDLDKSLSDLFVNGIVTHEGSNNGNSSVSFSWETQLQNGSSSLLHADSVSNQLWDHTKSCTSTDCSTNNSYAPKSALNLPDFSTYASHSNDDYQTKWSSNWQLILTPSEYKSVTLSGSNPILTFNSGNEGNDALYQINTLSLSNGTVNFGPGRYWIKNFTMNSGVKVNFKLAADEQVVLIVKNSFRISNDLNTNGDANQLIIINYNDLTLAESKTVNGFLYAQDTLTLSSGSTVNGAVAGHTVNLLSRGAKVVFNNKVPNINFTPKVDYHFDECQYTGADDEVIDQTGSYPATRHGAVNTFADGQIQRALELTNKDQHIETSIPLPTNFSVSTWFKKPTSNTDNRYFVLGAMENGGDLLYLDRNKNWRWGVYTRAGSADGTFSFETLDNNWHHMVLVYSGGRTRLYVDGIYKDSVNRAPAGTLTFIGTSFDDVTSNSAQGFRAPLDEFMVFDSVLTKNQIQSIYTEQNAKNNYDGTTRAPGSCSLSPLAEWRMDENAWYGKPNEVIDSSGNKNHGTAQNSLSTTNDAHICRAGEFDGEDDYIENAVLGDILSDTASMSFWIKTSQTGDDTAWRAPGISGVEQVGGTDDIFWGWLDASGHIGVSVGNDNSSKSGAVINDGVFHHIVLTRDAVTGDYKIYIDGSLDKSGTTGTGVIGTAFSSIGRIEGGNGYFKGQLDELKIYAGILSDAQVNELYDDPRTCGAEQIDHYQIIHDGSGLTCAAESITIKACLDEGCTKVAPDDASVILSATGATSVWSANPVTIPGGSSTGVNVNLTHTTAELVTLDASSAPAAVNSVECSPSCDLPFSDSGYLLTLANHQSCSTENLTIQAVKLSDTGVSCAPAYIGDQSVDFVFNYTNPDSGTKVPILADADMAAATVSQNRTVNFDNTGTATLSFAYQDAGKISIGVSDAAAKGLASAAITTVISPAKLIVASSDSNAACTSNDADCTVFKAAGEAFNLSVSATCDNDTNTVTPNFKMNNIPLSVKTVAPALGNPVSLGVDSINISDAGTHTIENQTISEVGVFTITATPPADGYFGVTVPPATSASIGRFTPHHFQLSITENGQLNGGNPFVYNGQMSSPTSTVGQISYETNPTFTITAKSLNNSTTLNYTGDFMKLQADDIIRLLPTADATQLGADGINNVNLIADLNTVTLAALNGVVNYQFNSTDNYVYTHEANARIAPFSAGINLQITSITDSDGITADDTDSDATNGVLTLHPLGVEIRFGRWYMENSYGPETSDLRMPMSVQYWDGSNFVTNNQDSFTAFSSSSATISDNKLTPAAPDPVVSGIGLFINGETKQLMLKSPGVDTRGSVTLEFTVPTWLQYDWDNDGFYDNNPSALATFGLYRGNDRIIYRREVFE